MPASAVAVVIEEQTPGKAHFFSDVLGSCWGDLGLGTSGCQKQRGNGKETLLEQLGRSFLLLEGSHPAAGLTREEQLY